MRAARCAQRYSVFVLGLRATTAVHLFTAHVALWSVTGFAFRPLLIPMFTPRRERVKNERTARMFHRLSSQRVFYHPNPIYRHGHDSNIESAASAGLRHAFAVGAVKMGDIHIPSNSWATGERWAWATSSPVQCGSVARGRRDAKMLVVCALAGTCAVLGKTRRLSRSRCLYIFFKSRNVGGIVKTRSLGKSAAALYLLDSSTHECIYKLWVR